MRPGSRIPFVPSVALLVRADVALGPDLFDAALRGGEDVDLVWRLGEAGWDVRYVPSSTAARKDPATLRAFLGRRAFYGTTAAPLARRHGKALAPVHLSGWSLAVWSLVLARRPLLACWRRWRPPSPSWPGVCRGLVRDPVGVAAHIAGGGTTRAALPALAALTRAWSPALVLGLAFRRVRAVSALALLVPALSDWAADRQGLDPVRAVAVHVADDVAYGTGVWAGCVRERTLVPLVPRVSWRSRVWSSPTLRHELQPATAVGGERLSWPGVAGRNESDKPSSPRRPGGRRARFGQDHPGCLPGRRARPACGAQGPNWSTASGERGTGLSISVRRASSRSTGRWSCGRTLASASSPSRPSSGASVSPTWRGGWLPDVSSSMSTVGAEMRWARFERRMRDDALCGEARLRKLLPLAERLQSDLYEPLAAGLPAHRGRYRRRVHAAAAGRARPDRRDLQPAPDPRPRPARSRKSQSRPLPLGVAELPGLMPPVRRIPEGDRAGVRLRRRSRADGAPRARSGAPRRRAAANRPSPRRRWAGPTASR